MNSLLKAVSRYITEYGYIDNDAYQSLKDIYTTEKIDWDERGGLLRYKIKTKMADIKDTHANSAANRTAKKHGAFSPESEKADRKRDEARKEYDNAYNTEREMNINAVVQYANKLKNPLRAAKEDIESADTNGSIGKSVAAATDAINSINADMRGWRDKAHNPDTRFLTKLSNDAKKLSSEIDKIVSAGGKLIYKTTLNDLKTGSKILKTIKVAD